jgi:hypothetical protein
MIKLPKAMRSLKFDSQKDLAAMITFSINGFIKGLEDHNFTEKSSKKLDELANANPFRIEEYEIYYNEYFDDYQKFILSRYVNIMPNFVGVTGSPLEEALFTFKIGELKTSDNLFSDKTLKYWDIGYELMNEFLPLRCSGFKSIPKQ